MAKINWTPYLIIYYLVGVVGLALPLTRELFTAAIPFTLLASTAVLLLSHPDPSPRFWRVAILIFLLGIGVEIAGVATGLIFGTYEYGATLGPKILHTPLVIGLNWFMLIYCTLFIAGRFVAEPYFRALLAAAMMVVYDVALEPAAISLDMWSWENGAVPFQNYLAWFVISLGLGLLGGRLGLVASGDKMPRNKVATPLFFIQLGFFLVLDLLFLKERLWGSF